MPNFQRDSQEPSLGDDLLNPETPHRPMRHIGHDLWNNIPGWALRTTGTVRSNNYFAGAPAYFAGATTTSSVSYAQTNPWKEGGRLGAHPHMPSQSRHQRHADQSTQRAGASAARRYPSLHERQCKGVCRPGGDQRRNNHPSVMLRRRKGDFEAACC